MAIRELVTEVFSPSGNFALRAQPSSTPQGVFTISGLWRFPARLLHHDRSWTVRVRRREDDYPGGAVVASAITPSKAEAKALLEAWATELRSGTIPAARVDGDR
jgi:hypothetical protein